MGGWSSKDIPSQKGRTVIVTGGNCGIGYETALELVKAGAHVIIATRDPARGEEAVKKIKEQVGAGAAVAGGGAKSAAGTEPEVEFEAMDLTSLASVRSFATKFLARGVPLDLLINNAGVMNIPTKEVTVDGFERQTQTNHLGHFALTGLLMPALEKSTQSPRIVTVASLVVWAGDLSSGSVDARCETNPYSPTRRYANSKLANLCFMNEFNRRFPVGKDGNKVDHVAAHPGGTATQLMRHTSASGFLNQLMQSQAVGALPSLRAAVDRVYCPSGGYIGPRWSMYGYPMRAYQPRQGYDPVIGQKIWDEAVALTGVKW